MDWVVRRWRISKVSGLLRTWYREGRVKQAKFSHCENRATDFLPCKSLEPAKLVLKKKNHKRLGWHMIIMEKVGNLTDCITMCLEIDVNRKGPVSHENKDKWRPKAVVQCSWKHYRGLVDFNTWFPWQIFPFGA